MLPGEAVEALRVRPGGIYVDGTAGGGGHAARIAAAGGRVVAIDKDPAAIAALEGRLGGIGATVVREDFRHIPAVLDKLGIGQVDGVLLDLGVSSPQLDDAGRGFSYVADAPLDMRMSGQGPSAYDLINTWGPEEIARVLWEYGEEKFSRRIAANIVAAREKAPIKTTGQLSDIIRASIPAPARRTGGNPAKRSFQAIRIAVNGELEAVEEVIPAAFGRLAPGGRFCIITFHSLEDRIVKQQFAALCRGCTCPPGYPVCVCGKKPRARAVTRKPVTPGEGELRENKRAHSAKLRAVEKL